MFWNVLILGSYLVLLVLCYVGPFNQLLIEYIENHSIFQGDWSFKKTIQIWLRSTFFESSF